MDFNKLNTFIEVAKTESISKAAHNLFRTQPAVTQQIAALEESLEIRLLERKHGRIYLTKQGRQLFDHSAPNLQSIVDYLAEIKNELELLKGEIRVGVRADVAREMLVPTITRFHQNYPNVKITIVHGDAAETETRLLENKIDVGVQLLVQDLSLLEARPIYSRPAILAAGSKYLKKSGIPKKPSDLLNHTLIDFTENCDAIASWTHTLDKSVELELRKSKPHFICPDHGIAAEILKRNLGICAMPLHFIENEYKKGEIKALMTDQYSGNLTFNLVTRKNGNLTAAERAFVEIFQEE